MSAQKKTSVSGSSSSIFPMSGWFRSITATFPRITFDAVPVLDCPEKPAKFRQNPVLYVQQGHPTPHIASSSSSSAPSKRWASRDPRCLAWQMNLAFRGIKFDCVHIHDDWTSTSNTVDGGYHGEGFSNVPIILDVDSTVVGQKHLLKWADSIQPFPDEVQQFANTAEARTLESVIQGPLMAGVLLELVLLPYVSSSIKSKVPFLSRQVQAQLAIQKKSKMIAQIQALRHTNPTSRMPGWITTMHGLLNTGSMGTASNVDAGDGDGLDDGEQVLSLIAGKVDIDQIEQSSIRSDACDAINIIANLYGLESEAGKQAWIGGNPTPSHLDAMLFALLHTIMSLPVSEDPQLRPIPEESLRLTIEKHSNLTKYMRSIWTDYVKPRGG